MGLTQARAIEQSLEPIRTTLDKKRKARKSLKEFIERNKDQKFGVQINFFNGPEHVCIGISHPEDVQSLTSKVLDTLDGQIQYFEDAINKLTK